LGLLLEVFNLHCVKTMLAFFLYIGQTDQANGKENGDDANPDD